MPPHTRPHCSRRLTPSLRDGPRCPDKRRIAALLVVFCVMWCAAACKDNTVEPLPPTPVSTVQITSSSGELHPIGRDVALTVEAHDSMGEAIIGVTLSLESSNTDVATVDSQTLVVTTQGPGEVTITATESGTGITDSIELEVLDVSVIQMGELLDLLSDLFSDPFADALVANMTASISSIVRTTIEECLQAATEMNLSRVREELGQIHEVKSSVTNPDNQVLLWVLEIVVAHPDIVETLKLQW